MHYYQHNIKTFNSATRHLSRLARSLYRDLIELYYENEGPLCSDVDKLCHKLAATSKQERSLVEQMLNEFFEKSDTCDGWIHRYCETVIAGYRKKKKHLSDAGKASQKKQKEKRGLNENDDEQMFNSETTSVQLTNNHKPITNREGRRRFTPPTLDEVQAYCAEKGYGVDPETFLAFYETRGWVVGKVQMKDWKAAVRTWVQREKKTTPTNEVFYL